MFTDAVRPALINFNDRDGGLLEFAARFLIGLEDGLQQGFGGAEFLELELLVVVHGPAVPHRL